jgi:hypothetical protein
MGLPKGFHHSKETRDKIRQHRLGKKHSKATILKIIEANRKRKHSIKTKLKMSALRKGIFVEDKCPAWKGGRIYDGQGYIMVLNKKHPFCKKNGYVYEHRLVIEQYLGRYMLSSEHTHHINKIRDDNRIKNLMVFRDSRTHRKYEFGKRIDPQDIIFDGRNIK